MADDLDIAMQAETPAQRRRFRTLSRISGASALAIAVLLGGLYVARKPIADHYIAQTLREKGVPGSYVISRIGPRTQRLENLVLGDPAHPDLTARWVEVDLGYGFSGVGVTALRAEGVRVAARYRNGTLDLGSIGKLMGEGGGGKAELPDIEAELADVHARLATDGGDVALALEGKGNLRSGFAGQLQAAAPRLALNGCALDGLDARTSVASEDGKLHFKGPIAVRGIACADMGLGLSAPRIEADLRGDPALADMSGALALSADEARHGGRSIDKLSGLMTFKGSVERLEGSAALSAERTALGFASTGPLKLGGQFAARPRAKDQDYSYSGTLTAEGIRPASQADFARIETAAVGTPLDPLARKLAGALRNAARANRLTASGRLSGEGRQMQLLVNGADFSAASGARVALDEGSRFTLDLPRGDWALDGRLTSGGGGLPEGTVALASDAGGGVKGRLVLKDYRAGAARLGLTPVTFSRNPTGDMHVATTVSLDGPIGDGAVRGLQLPVDARISRTGAIRLAGDCTPLRWTALRISSASFDPARLSVCGLGGSDMRAANVALTGKIGDSPLMLSAKTARYGLSSGRIAIADLEARIGAGPNPVLLQAGALEGVRARDGAFAGTLAQGRAIIGSVPLDQSNIAGQWRFAGGALTLDGAMRVSDRQQDARFEPLDAEKVHLTLANGRIDAGATLASPRRKVAVATVTLGHDLGSGIGQASFKVDGLTFGGAVQPDDLTRMSQGVVQLVEGPVEGSGVIRWSPQGVTESTGTFSLRDMNFAAAFGPVKGFSTTIHFTDLLGLKTAPHQRMTIKQVSAGVDVFDGVIDYALLSNERAQIEDGRWPFSGGTLELLPVTLDLDARQPRHFAFRVIGLDAAAFVNTLKLENVDVHGTLDGLFPMTFDQNGGRIDDGVLVARQAGLPPLILAGPTDLLPSCDTTRQGGSLAYVGQVSNAQLGTMGKFAFDALKHFNYRCLVVRLDGALDGEFVTQIRINGINQGSEEGRHSWLVRPFLKLPMIFNVRIEAPFRRLLGIYSTLNDPSDVIRDEISKQRAKTNSPLAVQPADSEKSPEGNTK
ncbi:MAG: YdbH domain-containing protein [Sphingobium sp.]|nr:YdbH domain-containing protein [Sphingobium sp.]